MSIVLFVIGQVLPYITVAVFVLGVGYRFLLWLKTPAPLKIPLTPGPKTPSGVIGRLAVEVATFRSLLYSGPWLWAGGWLTHFMLLLIIAGHLVGISTLGREFMPLGFTAEQSTRASALLGSVLGLAIIPPIIYLLGRRAWNERVRYASAFSDYFALALILLIVVTGDYMRLLSPIDLALVKSYVANLARLHPTPIPANGIFVAHFALVNVLLLYLPFSKLLHGVGMFFSPTLDQANDARERRHVNPWDRLEVS